MKRLLAILLAAPLVTPPLVASESARDWGHLYASATIASEYRFNGMSLSDRDPALQLSLHWLGPARFHAGMWSSNVDFNDANDTRIEVDVYGGRSFKVKEADVRAEVMYTSFDDDEPGPTYDFFQLKLHAARTFDRLTPGILLKFSPDGSYGAGRTWHVRSELGYRITPWLGFDAMLGRGFYERSSERTYWEVGFSSSWKKLHFDLRYVDMHTDLPLCEYVDWCEAAVVGKIMLANY